VDEGNWNQFYVRRRVLPDILGWHNRKPGSILGLGNSAICFADLKHLAAVRLMIIFPLLAVCIDLLMAVFINETAFWMHLAGCFPSLLTPCASSVKANSNESAAIWWTVILLGQV
jgi:hypothetical protein